ncbi:MAG: ABC transporter permease [Candidatus Rokuibacteriota bacterium]
MRTRLTDHPLAVRLASLALVLLAWEWYGRRVDRIFLSYPTAIAAAAGEMLRSGELPAAMLASAWPLAAGFLAGVGAGVVVGFLMGRYRLLEWLLDPLVNAFYATPGTAILPLLMLWFGLGVTVKIVIVFSFTIFPVLVNTFIGVRDISAAHVDVARAFGAREREIIAKVLVPAALPFIATGVRLAVGRAIVGMIAAEFFTALSGLGQIIVASGNAYDTDRLFVAILVLALAGVGLTRLVEAAEDRLAAWKLTERAQA